jgi:putative ubiquitin-RnfH superfamily antitoxin RatB of RatAB toxin-antitoxin module
MAAEKHLSITLVFSPAPREIRELLLVLPIGCTVAQALHASDILNGIPVSELSTLSLGIWGRKVGASDVLQDFDRLEIYRALTVDPKVARRERFVRQGAKRAAGLFAKRRVGAKAGY